MWLPISCILYDLLTCSTSCHCRQSVFQYFPLVNIQACRNIRNVIDDTRTSAGSRGCHCLHNSVGIDWLRFRFIGTCTVGRKAASQSQRRRDRQCLPWSVHARHVQLRPRVGVGQATTTTKLAVVDPWSTRPSLHGSTTASRHNSPAKPRQRTAVNEGHLVSPQNSKCRERIGLHTA